MGNLKRANIARLTAENLCSDNPISDCMLWELATDNDFMECVATRMVDGNLGFSKACVVALAIKMAYTGETNKYGQWACTMPLEWAKRPLDILGSDEIKGFMEEGKA